MAINKIIDPNVAAQAYMNSSNIPSMPGRSSGGGAIVGPQSFGDMVEAGTREAIDTMKRSEELSAKSVTGEADITEVVQAVTDAEVTLQTVVALRDRMVSAYQEIMRMPV